MQDIHIRVKDSYLQKFLNLLDALPQDEIKIVDLAFEQDRKMLHQTLKNYKNGTETPLPYDEGMEEIDTWLDTLIHEDSQK